MSGVLVHIGFPKAGSTFLQKWFLEHPEMHYQFQSIVGFNSAHDMARYAQRAERVHNFFVFSSEDLGVWKGDVDVLGFRGKTYNIKKYHENLSNVFNRIFPEAKILIVTRGYDAMFKSLYSQYIRGGGTLSFDELQSTYGEQFTLLYDYSWIVQQYRKVCGEDNVIVLPYELLKESPNRFTAIIERELTIDGNFSIDSQIVNPSLTPQTLAGYRQLSKFLLAVLGLLPRNSQESLFRFHVRNLQKNDNHLLAGIIEKFNGKIDQLEVQAELLEALKGKADILAENELYQPFLKEYLIGD